MNPNISAQLPQPTTPEAQATVTQPMSPAPIKSSSKSKYILFIALIFLILVIGVGMFFLGKSSNSNKPVQATTKVTVSPSVNLIMTPTESPSVTLSPSPTTQSQSVIVNPNSVVKDYYNWWLSCLNQKLSGAEVHCSYNKTGALTDALVIELNQASGFDPILCAQNIPGKINFDNAVLENTDTAKVEVHTVWGASLQRNISVGLQQINNQWKISSINCNK